MCSRCKNLQRRLDGALELRRGMTDRGAIALLQADIAELEALLNMASESHPMSGMKVVKSN